MNVVVYVDNKRVAKEEMNKIEIRNENVKRILSEKLKENCEVVF